MQRKIKLVLRPPYDFINPRFENVKMGCVQHPQAPDNENWISIRIPNICCNIVYIKRKDCKPSEDAVRYLDLLREELAFTDL